MGCILQQLRDGEHKVIGYASKSFKDAKLCYCTMHGELAPVIYGLKYYRHSLLGFPFMLRTNHAALIHLLQTLHLVMQSAHYLDTLVEYQFSTQYQPGLVHHNTDTLSW